MKQVCNLVLITKGEEVLLAMKKRGFGAGKWNGYGGKVQPGESVEASAFREVTEESGLTANALKPRGQIDFHFPDGFHMLIHLYSCTDYTGEPVETEEMRPQWYEFSDIPYAEMWDDDRFWLPQFLAGQDIRADFTFDAENKVAKYKLNDGQEIAVK
jgi:8-oxo-dGTP diphosphatase/2-hydroxy-dATP diphosphatase